MIKRWLDWLLNRSKCDIHYGMDDTPAHGFIIAAYCRTHNYLFFDVREGGQCPKKGWR